MLSLSERRKRRAWRNAAPIANMPSPSITQVEGSGTAGISPPDEDVLLGGSPPEEELELELLDEELLVEEELDDELLLVEDVLLEVELLIGSPPDEEPVEEDVFCRFTP